MLNICGVTYTFTSNYGSCLQAYALQTAIERMSIKGEKVTYRLLPIGRCPGYPKSTTNGIKRYIKKIITRYARKQFIGFEEKYMHYTPIYPIKELYVLNDQMDGFVCGSDIIWNPKFNHGLSSYYLDFATKYAFSYAASFGQADINPEAESKVGEMISKLMAVSVRENRSAEIAEMFTGRKAQIVVDPVLLLDQNAWNEIAEKENINGKYIFVYSVSTTGLLKQFVHTIAKQTGLEVIYSGGNAGAVLKSKIYKVHTPQRWLQLMRDAEYVVTDSFHGTAFATLFQRNFYTVLNGDPCNGFNMRMNDYLKGVGLGSRIYTSTPSKIDLSPVDYSHANELLNRKVSCSYEFLKSNLEAAYQEKQGKE